MKNLLFFLISIVSIQCLHAQKPEKESSDKPNTINRQFSEPKEKQKRAPENSYKIISIERDTTYIDTSLTIKKHYKFNYLRKDDFELENFVNIGSPYNQLSKQNSNFRSTPTFGAEVRSLGLYDLEDIYYYQVATPYTELFFKTALEQGQQMDAFVTFNTKPHFNMSFRYRGIRSLGSYQNMLTSTKSFQGTFSYSLPNNKYVANGHYTNERLLNNENGGLSDAGLDAFLNIGEESNDRAIIGVEFENAENTLDARRILFDHEYRFVKPDTLGNGKLALNHQIEYAKTTYWFTQTTPDETYFGTAQQSDDEFIDEVILQEVKNKLGLSFTFKDIGAFNLFTRYSFFNYGYDNLYVVATDTDGDSVVDSYEVAVTNRIIDRALSVGGSYKNSFKSFEVAADFENIIDGNFSNQFFQGRASYQLNSGYKLQAGYQIKSEAPSFMKQLYQSNYIDYYWDNQFENTLTNTLSVALQHDKRISLKASYSLIDNYTYYDRVLSSYQLTQDEIDDEILVPMVSSPSQYSGTLGVLKLKAFNEVGYEHFRLANTIMFQQISGDENNVYNVPSFVTRNSLYYQGKVFQKAMFLQTGVDFKWFTKYHADGYDPLIAEYYIQNEQEIGGYPMLDLFLNARVRQTRIYFNLENFHNLFLGQNNDLVAPNYASRDMLLRFGLVWNFFL